MKIPDDTLRGRRVLSSDGVEIGVVEGVIFETSAWKVEALEVRLRNEVATRIGAGRKMFRPSIIEVPVDRIHSVRDAVILSVSLGELRPSA
jgi:sporulation protein YlmC with PRC-barrel domain